MSQQGEAVQDVNDQLGERSMQRDPPSHSSSPPPQVRSYEVNDLHDSTLLLAATTEADLEGWPYELRGRLALPGEGGGASSGVVAGHVSPPYASSEILTLDTSLPLPLMPPPPPSPLMQPPGVRCHLWRP